MGSSGGLGVGHGCARRVAIEGTGIEIVIHAAGDLSCYLRGRWICGGRLGFVAVRALLEGIEPGGSVVNGRHHEPGPPGLE